MILLGSFLGCEGNFSMLVSHQIMIKNFGSDIENAWKTMRPITQELLIQGLKPGRKKPSQPVSVTYDVRIGMEISNLLSAIDEHAIQLTDKKLNKKLDELSHLADVCVDVLQTKIESAEIFIQLAERALKNRDFEKIDTLSDILLEKFQPSEIAEVIRQTTLAPISAIAHETLAIMPTASITPLLKDSLYFEIACRILEQQAVEFENEEAIAALEKMDPRQFFI